MEIAAFVLSIIAAVILVALAIAFIWLVTMVNKQETIEKNTEELLEQKYNPNVCQKLTLKGIAVIAAVESGLLPRIDGGWDDTAFNKFWDTFERVYREMTGQLLELFNKSYQGNYCGSN